MHFDIKKAGEKFLDSGKWFLETRIGRGLIMILATFGLTTLSACANPLEVEPMPETPTAERLFTQLKELRLDWKWAKIDQIVIETNLYSQLHKLLDLNNTFDFRKTTNPAFDSEQHVFIPLTLSKNTETPDNNGNPSVIFFSVANSESGEIVAVIKLDPTRSQISAFPPHAFEKNAEVSG